MKQTILRQKIKLRILIKKLFRKYLRYVARQTNGYVPMIYPLDCEGFEIDEEHIYTGKSDYIIYE